MIITAVLSVMKNKSVTGDANRGNFLPMLKLTAKMQHTFYHEANIITYIIDFIG